MFEGATCALGGGGIDEPLVSDQSPPPVRPAYSAPAPPRSGWALLDPFTARHATSLTLELAAFRPLSAVESSPGGALAYGEALSTVRGPFIAGALREHALRLVPGDALSLTLSRYQWEAGLRLALLEPQLRVGFGLLHLDVADDGVSFGMFTPRVGAGLWLKLSAVRVGVSVFSEYFWRWAGGESAFVRGLTLEIQPAAPPLRKPRPQRRL